MDSETLVALASELGQVLRQRQQLLATAESCTGGWVGQLVTSVPGSSRWYERGFITYTNNAKREMLEVAADILSRHGAVSEATARAMAVGALKHSRAHYSLAITGIAGPGGGSSEKPVGTVCFAWAGRQQQVASNTQHFSGDRQAIRQQAVAAAMRGMLDYLQNQPLAPGPQRVSRPEQVVK